MSKCTRKGPTAQAVRQSMEQHDGLVHAFIRRQGGGQISSEEALQAGRVGLWHGIQGYDPARGTATSTYAWVAIWRQIHRRAKELSRDSDVPLLAMPSSGFVRDPAEEVDRRLTKSALQDLVGQLPKRLGQVIAGRYGLGEQPPGTLKEREGVGPQRRTGAATPASSACLVAPSGSLLAPASTGGQEHGS